MIAKNTPRQLDKSSDYRLIPSTAMVDALNLSITESVDTGESQSGDLGVLKNILGTESSITISVDTGETREVEFKPVGACVDERLGLAAVFVWSSIPKYHTVIFFSQTGNMWDVVSQAYLTQAEIRSPRISFSENSFVKGNFIRSPKSSYRRAGVEYADMPKTWQQNWDKDVFVYFTDGDSEPKKVNLSYYLSGLKTSDPSTTGSPGTNYLSSWAATAEDYSENDVVLAAPRTPLKPILFEFGNDATSRSSNFKNIPGFQFSYQYVYRDGTESAMSPYSDVAFPPSVLQQGNQPAPDHNEYNQCTLDVVGAYTKEWPSTQVEKIRIMARQGNVGRFFIIDEVLPYVSSPNWIPLTWSSFSSRGQYVFKNDSVVSAVSKEEEAKQFNNLPRKAKAQTVQQNRLFYGNYVDGYDGLPDVSVTSSVTYRERKEEGRSGGLSIEPAVYHGPKASRKWGTPTAQNVNQGGGAVKDPDLAPGHVYGDGADEFQFTGAVNKSIGFRINTEGLSDFYESGSEVTINIGLLPNNNFHVYEARGSYHGSRHLTHRTGHKGTVNSSNGNPDGPLNFEAGLMQTKVEAGDKFLRSRHQSDWAPGNNGKRWTFRTNAAGPSYFGKNAGVGQRMFADGESLGISYGTGDNYFFWHDHTTHRLQGQFPNNPPEEQIYGYASSGPQPRKAFYGTSAANPLIFKGEKLLFSITVKTLQDVSGARSKISKAIYDGLVGGAGNLRTELASDLSITAVQRVCEVEYDLGLFNGKSIAPGGSLSDLVCGLKVAKKALYGAGTANAGGNVADSLYGAGTATDGGANDAQTDDGGFTATCQSYSPPDGYFILNKAKVEFYIEPTISGNNFVTNGNDGDDFPMLKIAMGTVKEADVWTCIKPLTDPNGGWTALDPAAVRANQWTPIKDWVPGSLGDVFTPWFGQGQQTIDDYARKISAGYENALNPFWRKYYKGLRSEGGADFAGPACQIGYLGSNDGRPTRLLSAANLESFCRTRTRTDADATASFNGDQWSQSLSSVSLLDGQCGPGAVAKGQLLSFNERENHFRGSVGYRCDIFASDRLRDVWSTGDAYDPPGDGQAGFDLDNDGAIDWDGSYEDSGNTSISNNYYPRESPRYGRSFSYGLATFNGYNEDGGNYNKRWPRLTQSSREGVGIDGTNRNAIAYFSGPFWTGDIRMNPAPGAFGSIGEEKDKYDATTILPYLEFNFEKSGEFGQEWPSWGDPFQIQGRHPFPKLDENNDMQEGVSSFDFRGNPAALDNQGTSFNTVSSLSGLSDYMSFKSGASHSFGVVYYDERGRHGFVNPIPDVYVAGYGDTERGAAGKGAAEISISLSHEAPSWAKNWKIVYGGNSGVSDFTQYFSGGAFVRTSEVEENQTQNIYVSLNYLQNHPISYVSSFGARPAAGGLDMYRFQPGDRLKVLSFATGGPDTARQYPDGYEFEVVDYVLLGQDQNPFIESDPDAVADERHKGAFLVLKDNYKANGFTYSDVKSGIHNWGDNAMIEVYSPAKLKDDEEKIYYEIGDTYDVLYNSDPATGGASYVHSPATVTLRKGDVFFRKVPVNAREVQEPQNEGEFSSSAGFKDLLVNTLDDQNVNGSKPKFREYYCETKAANDTFPSDSINRGRPNFYLPEAAETFRDATITYSDLSNPGGNKMNYGSFNPSLANFKDLREEFGPIQSIENMGDDIFVIQSDRCTTVPVNRNIIQSADGNTQLTTSTNVLGAAYVYATDAGCDFNPESIAVVDGVIYFAHKSMGKVFRYNQGSGIEEISDRKTASFFRDTFEKAIANSEEYNAEDVRVVGGYDPKNDEYIITIIDPGQNYEYPDSTVLGCMDPVASNYEVAATIDSGGCLYDEVVFGCTDPSATNLTTGATVDDGSCTYIGNPNPPDTYTTYDVVFTDDLSEGNGIVVSVNAEYDPVTQRSSLLWSAAEGLSITVDGVAVTTNPSLHYLTSKFTSTLVDGGLDADPDANFTVRAYLPYTILNSDSGLRMWSNALYNASNNTVTASLGLSALDIATFSGFQGNQVPAQNGEVVFYVTLPSDGFVADDSGYAPAVNYSMFSSNVLDGSATIQTSLEIEVIDNLANATNGVRRSISLAAERRGPQGETTYVKEISIPITININTTTLDVEGCTDSRACNFYPLATIDDGSCLDFYQACDLEGACNYQTPYVFDNASQAFILGDKITFDSSSSCYSANESLCDFGCYGCMDVTADNYDADATIDNGFCVYSTCPIPAEVLCDMSGYFDGSDTPDGVITYPEMYGWVSDNLQLQTVPFSNIGSYMSSYANSQWDNWDENCTATLRDVIDYIKANCGPEGIFGTSSEQDGGGGALGRFDDIFVGSDFIGDEDGDLEEAECEITGAQVVTYALMWWISQKYAAENQAFDAILGGITNFFTVNFWVEGTSDLDFFCQGTVPGCTDPEACNFNSEANFDNNSCEFPETYYDCEGNCLNDEDGDGICDELEVLGCNDSSACNYNPLATDDDGSCLYLDACGLCGGSASEEDVCEGCLTPNACNYNPDAITHNGGLCDFTSCAGCTDVDACNYDETATIENGSCQYITCQGCTDSSAMNYNPEASIDNGTCQYAVLGCTDPSACNYSQGATQDDATCDFDSCKGCTDEDACNYDAAATIDDGCDFDICAGCTDETACNYDMDASIDDGSCDFADCAGCTDNTACNFDDTATVNDGSCIFPITCQGVSTCPATTISFYLDENFAGGYTVSSGGTFEGANYNMANNPNIQYGFNINGVDLTINCESGCTDASACNFNEAAVFDDGSCAEVDCNGDCGGDALFDACGICGGPGAIYECGCNDIPDGNCDCSGNEDGSDGCQGCIDPNASNYNDSVDKDCEGVVGGSNNTCCRYPCPCLGENVYVTIEECANCTPGCTDDTACNFSNIATIGNATAVSSCIPPTLCDDNQTQICGDGVNTIGLLDECPAVGQEPNYCQCTEIGSANYNAWMPAQTTEVNIKNCLYYSGTDDEILSQEGVVIAENILSLDDAQAFIKEAYGFNSSGGPSDCRGQCTGAEVMEINFPNYSPCPADLNGDGSVSTADLLSLLSKFGQVCDDNEICSTDQIEYFGSAISVCPADIDGDGTVGTTDLLSFLASFGQECRPPLSGSKQLPRKPRRIRQTLEGRNRCDNACNIYDAIVGSLGLVVTERQVATAMGCAYAPCSSRGSNNNSIKEGS